MLKNARFFAQITPTSTDVQVITPRKAFYKDGETLECFRTFKSRGEHDDFVKRLIAHYYHETLTVPSFGSGETDLLTGALRKDAFKRISQYLDDPDKWFLNRWLTDKRYQDWQSGALTDEQAWNIARKRLERDTFRQLVEDENHLKCVMAGKEPETISVLMEYRRSGAVHCTVNIDNRHCYKGSAYGGGYDKRSAALADALNKSYDALSILAHAKHVALNNGETDWSATASSGRCNHDMLGYGAGYSVVPYYEGGVGMSTIIALLTRRGYKVVGRVHAKDAEAFTLVRKEED